MLTAAEFSQLLGVLGEPVTLRQAKAPNATFQVMAIVQDTSKLGEAVVNAYGISGKQVQLAASTLSIVPEKFDIVTRANGERLVFDTVNIEHTRGSGAVAYYIAYSKGK